ncbi:MAG: bifunctional UDP-N-acetylglucosamine diphosphorylase/glucosamine-1-phosphate N-acetyltransferase GlmU [Clostridia bacterium]|nr:bifunctional UDP-N-acetylglucosamine diphosphorylase/glucosamine-1-phosphate N-acetyltransferase GlmU [Clostridia bacterium]
MKGNCTVILAAGEGTRMKSQKPKVLAEVLFRPMIDWVIDCVKTCGLQDNNICVVTGFGKEYLDEHLPQSIVKVVQEERLGTGHAVMQAKEFISAHGNANVLVLNGDAPLMDSDTVSHALEYHKRSDSAVTVISAHVDNPTGYGRIVRDAHGTFSGIVEERDATDEQKAINEVNSGAYWFNCQALLIALDKLATDAKYRLNSAKEYYLTDAIEILRSIGQRATTFNSKSSDVVLGANDRVQLAALNEIARKRVLEKHMRAGVSIPFSDGVIIDPTVTIGADTEILCGTVLRSGTVIGKGCNIGPDVNLSSCVIGDGCHIVSVYGEDAKVGADTSVGPFARLRPGTVIGKDARVGNFVEVKNSSVGDGTKISHLSYVGDADVGNNVNIGSGCATVNYTGKEKFRTTIGDGAFIGCDTSLVAPVNVGERAYTAAGSTITEDVPSDALALGRARQVIKKDWVKSKKPYKK